MRIAYRAENLFDAHLVKDALERQQIPAFIAGEYLTGAVGQLPARDFVAVMVADTQIAAAESVVRDVEASLCEARAAIGGWDEEPPTSALVLG